MTYIKAIAAKVVAATKNAWSNYTDPEKMEAEKSFPMFRK